MDLGIEIMINSGKIVLKYLISLVVVFVMSFVVFISIHNYFLNLIADLDKKTDNLYVQEKIYIYMENEILSIRSKFFEMSATTTNKVGIKFLKDEIKSKILDIEEEIKIVKYGGILSKKIISNEVNSLNYHESIIYKSDNNSKTDIILTAILMKIDQLKDIIKNSKDLLIKRNLEIRDKNLLHIDTLRPIIRLNKTMPSFFNRIIENIHSLIHSTQEEIKLNKSEIEIKKALYSKLELLPIFLTLVILAMLTILIFRRILKLSKIIIQKSNKLQDLLDAQDNIVILTDGQEITMYNKAFTRFFSNEVVEDFEESRSCICKYFLDHEDYFSLAKIKDGECWIKYLQKQDKKDRVVKLMDGNFREKLFSVSIEEFKEKDYRYVISFSDITLIKNEAKRYEVLAIYDNLTNIYNRQKFNEVFSYELNKQKRYDEKLSLIMFDIDHFKSVNDNYGHNIGDQVLVNISNAISDIIRVQDTFARWGGEEFMVLLPHTDLEGAYRVAQKMRVAIESLSFTHIPHVTSSFGVIECSKSMSSIDIINSVDESLYRAKESGRNRVVKYRELEYQV